jgi:hypothetical protein
MLRRHCREWKMGVRGEPLDRQPADQVMGAPPSIDRPGPTAPRPLYGLPSERPPGPKPGGVLMPAVVKYQPADPSGLFVGASHGAPRIASRRTTGRRSAI